MKKPEINPKDLEKDINKLLSFLNNIDSLDIENMDIDKLEKDVNLFKEDVETKYKDHLDDPKQGRILIKNKGYVSKHKII